jgi:hypothetical protein
MNYPKTNWIQNTILAPANDGGIFMSGRSRLSSHDLVCFDAFRYLHLSLEMPIRFCLPSQSSESLRVCIPLFFPRFKLNCILD